MCERLQGKTDAYSAIWNYLSVLEQTKCISKHVLTGLILIAVHWKAGIFNNVLGFVIAITVQLMKSITEDRLLPIFWKTHIFKDFK